MKKNLIVVVLLALAFGGCKKMNPVGPSENPGPGHIPPATPVELPGLTYLLDAAGNKTKFWFEIVSLRPVLGSAVAIAPFNWPPGPIDWAARCQAVCYSVTMRYGVDPDYEYKEAGMGANFTVSDNPDRFSGPFVSICGATVRRGEVVECSTQGGLQPDGVTQFTTFKFLPTHIVVSAGDKGSWGSRAITTQYTRAQ